MYSLTDAAMLQLGLGSSLSRGGVLSAGFANAYSLDFDGTDDHIEISDDSSLALANEFTFSVWCRPTDSGGSQKLIDRGTVYSLHWDQENNKFGFSTTRSGNKHLYFGSTSSLNTWYHVVGVTSGGGGSGTMALYVTEAGESFGSAATRGSLQNATTDTSSFFIGSYDGAAYFTGLIDEVAVWDAALDADAVAAIYNSGVPIALDADDGNYDNSGDLQGWWRFEEGSGTSATDSSTNSNTGTFTSAPAYSTDVPL